MKILVIGGAGFIGSHIVDLLIDKGHKVVVVDDLRTGNKENLDSKAKLYELDMTKKELESVFVTEKPDMVCHQAAQVNVRISLKDPLADAYNNILGTINILECCKRHNVKKIVYASSGGARYGEPDEIPCKESHKIMPLSPYGISKHTAEHYVKLYSKLYGFDYNIVAYSNVYGPRQDPKGEAGVIALFLDWAMNDKECTIFGDGEQTRDYVYVGDVARANVLALEKETKSKNFNIGTGKLISVNDLFNMIKKIVGQGSSKHENALAGEVRDIALNCSLAKKELSWESEMSIEDGLKKTADWFKEI